MKAQNPIAKNLHKVKCRSILIQTLMRNVSRMPNKGQIQVQKITMGILKEQIKKEKRGNLKGITNAKKLITKISPKRRT